MRRLAGDVADRYVANVKIVETLARGYGFRPFSSGSRRSSPRPS